MAVIRRHSERTACGVRKLGRPSKPSDLQRDRIYAPHTMSRENIEIVRAMFEAWNAGDMDALRELHDPDIIMRPPKGMPEPGPFVGREAVMRQFEQLGETFDSHSLGPISDFIDAGDRVVVRVAYHAEGHGPEMNFELTHVFTVREGRVFYLEFFWDHAEALEAMGLSEEDVHAEP